MKRWQSIIRAEKILFLKVRFNCIYDVFQGYRNIVARRRRARRIAENELKPFIRDRVCRDVIWFWRLKWRKYEIFRTKFAAFREKKVLGYLEKGFAVGLVV